MTYDPTKVHYITTDTIDKILYESPITSDTYTGGDPVTPAEHDFSIAHDIGESVIANGMFSINGSDFYPCGLRIQGGPSSLVSAAQYVSCDMYADAGNVNVFIDNGFDTTQTVYIYYALEALS